MSLPNDFYDTIEGEDIIEVYDTSFIQVFRNVKFMEVCSYTVIDILMYEWPDLYDRSQKVTEGLLHSIEKTLDPEFSGVMPLDSIAPHLMREKFSYTRQNHFVTFRAICPVYKNGEKIGIATAAVARMENMEKDNISFLGKKI